MRKLVVVSIFCLVLAAQGLGQPKDNPMKALQATALLTVDKVEPCVEFWTKTFGFELLVSVPHGDAMGFAMLKSGPVELMYQSRASLMQDIPQVATSLGTSMLYFSLESLDPVRAKMGQLDLLLPERTTSYGHTEIAVRDPGGHVFIFSVEEPKE